MDMIECKDCGQKFTLAQDYTDHFERAKDSVRITGCKKPAVKK